MSVRTATLEDLPAIVRLGAAMHKESRYRRMTYSPARIAEMAAALMASPDGFVVLAEIDGASVGVMLGQVMRDSMFGVEPLACECGVFVQPEHRGSSAGGRMVKAYKDWALSRGAVFIDLGISTGVSEARTGEFYERLGFQRAGSLYSMEV